MNGWKIKRPPKPYRNLVCDPNNPTSALDRTAAGVLDALTATTAEVPSGDIDEAIRRHAGSTNLKAEAVKALRNLGYAIIAKKARHLSWYKLAGTPAEYEEHRSDVVREAYSRQVSICRELAGAMVVMPGDLTLAEAHRHSQMTALALGTDAAVGLSVDRVLGELAVLSAAAK